MTIQSCKTDRRKKAHNSPVTIRPESSTMSAVLDFQILSSGCKMAVSMLDSVLLAAIIGSFAIPLFETLFTGSKE